MWCVDYHYSLLALIPYFFGVFLIFSRSEKNQPFFISVLTWSASLWLVVKKSCAFFQDFYPFPIASFCRIVSKMNCKFSVGVSSYF